MVKFLGYFVPITLAARTKRDTNVIIDGSHSAFVEMATWDGPLIHGCHCPNIAGQGYTGVPLDAMDRTCQSWANAKSCLTFHDSPCAGFNVDSLPQYTWTGSCDSVLDSCERALCEADVFFTSELSAFQNQTTPYSVQNAITECHRDAVNPGLDSCCGSTAQFLRRY